MHPIDTLRKELPGLMLEPQRHHGLHVFARPEPTTLYRFLDGAETMEVT